MAGHAGQRGRRALLHGRRHAAREVHGLGGHDAPPAWQPPLPLVAPGDEALLRDRGHHQHPVGAGNMGARERAAALAPGARHPRGEQGGRDLHDRRPGRSAFNTREDPGARPKDPGLPDLQARQGARRRKARVLQPLGGAPRRDRRDEDPLLRGLHGRPQEPARRVPRVRRPPLRPRA